MRTVKFVIAILCLSSPPALLYAETIHVIVNKDSQINVLDKKTIKRIFLGRSVKLNSDIKFEPLDYDRDSDTYREFYSKVVRKSRAQVDSYWSREMFTGSGHPPSQVGNRRKIVEMVSRNTNYIAYVRGDVNSEKVNIVYSFDAP